jgi:Flp pilus assembly protein protease CpaA
MLNEGVLALARAAAVLTVGAVASATDLRERRVPNAVPTAGVVVGLGLAAAAGLGGLGAALAGAAVFGGPLLLFWLFGWCGAGDAKLGLALGALLGFPLAASGLLLGTLLGGAWCVLAVVWDLARSAGRLWGAARRAGAAGLWAVASALPVWANSLPYAAFLAAGSVVATALALRSSGWGV